MKSTLLKLVFLFIATSCICGMCSKDDETIDNNNSNNNNNNNPREPELKPDASWVYFDDCRSLVGFYNTASNATGFNNRPIEKWVATKIGTGVSGVNTSTGKRYLSWSFENTGDTRFLPNSLNPGGKETLSVFLDSIAATPATGSYVTNRSNCWYDVYTSSGAKHDSTRTQSAVGSSSFNITKIDFVQAIGPTIDRYKMSGNAVFNVMYWESGTGSTTDIHELQCYFNNVQIDFMK